MPSQHFRINKVVRFYSQRRLLFVVVMELTRNEGHRVRADFGGLWWQNAVLPFREMHLLQMQPKNSILELKKKTGKMWRLWGLLLRHLGVNMRDIKIHNSYEKIGIRTPRWSQHIIYFVCIKPLSRLHTQYEQAPLGDTIPLWQFQ